MSIGFALVTATLTINGVINLGFDAEDFDVYFSDAYLNEIQHKEFITQDGKNITFQTTLKSINEQSILKYEVMNNSKQYDAEVTISCTPENDELLTISNDIDSTTIQAQSKKEGNLTITLKKSVVEDVSKDINCELTINAIERTSKEEQQEPSTYSFGGILMGGDETPIANGKVIVYSKVPHEVTTDEKGYLYVEGLDRGSHEIYYVNEDVDASDKEAVKGIALASGNITTSYTSNEIKLDNGYEIKDVSVGKTSELIIASLETDEIDKRIVNGNTVTFPISGEYNNILCESEELPIEVSGEQVEIKNVNKSVRCYLSNDIYKTATKLKDEYAQGYIKILENISGTTVLALYKKTTMDINGKEVRINTNDSGIAAMANINIKDSVGTGKVINETTDGITIGVPNVTVDTNVNIEAGRSAIRIYSGGDDSTINFNGGNLNCQDWCIYVSKENETINLNNFVITSDIDTGTRLINIDRGVVNFNSGKIKVTKGGTPVSVYGGTFNMNGGIIEAENIVVGLNESATANFYKGQIISNTYYAISSKGTVNINGNVATFSEDGEYQDGLIIKSPQSHPIFSTGPLITINGGTLEGKNGIWACGTTVKMNGGEINSENDPIGVGTTCSSDIYVKGGTMKRTNIAATWNFLSTQSGNVYICGGQFPYEGISNESANVHIYYNKLATWKNQNTPTISGTYASNVTLNENLTCE